MTRRRWWGMGGVLLAIVAAGLVAMGTGLGEIPAPDESPPDEVPAPPSPPPKAPPLPRPLPWIVLGGGADPVSNQVSIEQDVALAARVFEARWGPGAVLFGGGLGTPVQVGGRTDEGDPLLGRLGRLLDPRDGRAARYRPTTLRPHGPASPIAMGEAIRRALTDPSASGLVLHVAGHGEPGEVPGDNFVSMWGGWGMSVRELATLLDELATPEPIRLAVTTCFSGGFADIIFRGGTVEQGLAAGTRCGVFATTWDREASGCDPNPDRGAQESYGLHFLHALQGRDRDGRPLKLGDVDLDEDGRVSLLEAHTHARISSRSIDVPTTTSERWLRHAVPSTDTGAAPLPLPEERATVTSIGRALGAGTREEAQAYFDDRSERYERLELDGEVLAGALDDAWSALRIRLLERWPVLDDPWHPDFADAIQTDRDRIAAVMDGSPEAREYARADAALAEATEQMAGIEAELALAERLLRAYETEALAGALANKGGAPWERYQQLLACERGMPTAE